MDNKGFTLAELIAILIILGILAIIAVPSIVDHVEESRRVAHDKQIERLIKVAKNYVVESEEFLYKDKDDFEIKLEDLKKNGYIENKDLIDPVTEKKMNGCIKVEYNETRDVYEYSYLEVCS